MINGVLNIVAAVLFAVIALDKSVDMIWLSIAGLYLLCGVVNLIVYSLRNAKKQKAAQKAETAAAAEAANG